MGVNKSKIYNLCALKWTMRNESLYSLVKIK